MPLEYEIKGDDVASRLRVLEGKIQTINKRFVPRGLGDTLAQFLLLPALRGMWSFANVDAVGNAYDYSEEGRTLAPGGTPTYAALSNPESFVPYVTYNGTTQFHSRADEADLSVTGALTVGGWFRPTRAIGTPSALISKWREAGDNRSYLLSVGPTNIIFSVSSAGTAATVLTASVAAAKYKAGGWYFAVGRFVPSTSLYLRFNHHATTVTTGVPASIADTTAQFNIGARNNGGADFLEGSAALVFLCASALSDTHIDNLYRTTRELFGVKR